MEAMAHAWRLTQHHVLPNLFSIHVDCNDQAHLSQHVILVLCDNGKKLLTHSIMLGSTSIDASEMISHVTPLCESHVLCRCPSLSKQIESVQMDLHKHSSLRVFLQFCQHLVIMLANNVVLECFKTVKSQWVNQCRPTSSHATPLSQHPKLHCAKSHRPFELFVNENCEL